MLTIRSFALTDRELNFVREALHTFVDAKLSEDNSDDRRLEFRLTMFLGDLQLAQRECLHPSER